MVKSNRDGGLAVSDVWRREYCQSRRVAVAVLVSSLVAVVATVKMRGLWVAVRAMGGLVVATYGSNSGGRACCWQYVAM